MSSFRLLAAALFFSSLLGCSAAEPDRLDSVEPASTTQAPSDTSPPVQAQDYRDLEDNADESDGEPVVKRLVGWWNHPEILSRLDLEEKQSEAMTTYLRNIELSYQLSQSKLKQARLEQTRMIEDPKASRSQIEKINREQLQPLSISMLELNIEARLWVREQLSDEQLASILKTSPGFFRGRWFRPSSHAVREGKIKEHKS